MHQYKELIAPQEKSILAKILDVFINNPEGVDIQQFRFDHLDSRRVIDFLDNKQLIRKSRDHTKYYPSLVGLYVAGSDLSQKIFKDIDRIAEVLRKKYKSDFDKPIKVDLIRKQLKMNKSYSVACLNWLCDGTHLGRTTDLSQDEATITPNEQLFDFEHYEEIPKQFLPSWFPDSFKASESPHRNTEVNASKREAILSAALSVLATYPQKCTSNNGQVKGSKIATILDQKSLILFPQYDGEPPLSHDKISRIVNKSINLLKEKH